jgi:hypothetical protein
MAGEVFTTVSRRAACAAFGIIPVTLAGIALILCGCSRTAWALEIATAAAYVAVIFAWGKR